MTPAPASFASELQGLLTRKTMLENKHASKKVKDSFSRALPTHIDTALKEWALVTKKNGPPRWTTTHNTSITGAMTSETHSLVPIITPCHPNIPVFLSAIPFTPRKL
eukprot:464353-Pelagomonas_calceolata.AAC.1